MTPGQFALNLRENLREFRTRSNLSQRKLGALAGVTQPMVSAIESGQRGCNSELAQRFAAALGVDVADLRSGNCPYCGNGTGVPAGWACPKCGRGSGT